MTCIISHEAALVYLYTTKVLFMKKNLGDLDIMLRALLAFAFANLGVDRALDGQFIAIYWIIAIFIGATSFTGFCPLYALLHIDSLGKKHEHEHK